MDRVVILHDFSQPRGGASYLVEALLKGLRARGLRTTLITGDDGERFDVAGVELVAVGNPELTARPALAAATDGFFSRRSCRAIRRWIAAHDTQRTIYHLHGWSKTLTAAALFALAPVASRLLIHAHDYFMRCPNGGYYNYRTNRDCPLTPLSGACLASNCDKTSYFRKGWRSARSVLQRAAPVSRKAARLIAVHEKMTPGLTRGRDLSPPVFVVPNPVEPLLMRRIAAERNERFFFVGRLSQEKGADLAAAACAMAGVPLTFIGVGALEARLREICPQATFAGWLSRARLAEEIAGARALLAPGRWSEPFGIAALEAAGAGVPIIISRNANIADEAAAGGFALAVDPLNVGALADAIRSLAADDARVEAMSRAAITGYSRLCLSTQQWIDRLCGHYLEVLAQSAGSAG